MTLILLRRIAFQFVPVRLPTMHQFSQKLISFKLVCALVFCLFGGCNQVRLPRIDPTGNRLFVPGNASYANPYQAIPAYQAPRNPLPCPIPQAIPSPGNQTPPPSVPPINLGAQSGPIGSGVRNANIPGGGLQLHHRLKHGSCHLLRK